MKLEKQLAKIYYTAAQARKRLGIDEQAFQYWTRKERIKRILLPGREQAVYSKKEVDEMANQIAATMLVEQAEGIDFRKATTSDVDQENELAKLIFGRGGDALEARQAFLEKNPDCDYHVYDQDRLVAYINIVPLKHDTIVDFLESKIGNIWTIDTNEIEQFEPGKPLECLVIDMITTPTVPPIQRRTYGAKLLKGLIQSLEEMGKRGIEITKVYAISRTSTGIRLLKGAGFQVIEVQNKRKNGSLTFELDVMRTDEKILHNYKVALKEAKKGLDRTKSVSKAGKRKVLSTDSKEAEVQKA